MKSSVKEDLTIFPTRKQLISVITIFLFANQWISTASELYQSHAQLTHRSLGPKSRPLSSCLAFVTPNATSEKSAQRSTKIPAKTAATHLQKGRPSQKQGSKAEVMRRRVQVDDSDSDNGMPSNPFSESPVMSGRKSKRVTQRLIKKEEVPSLWNIPNILTMLRVVAIPIFSGIFWANVEWRNIACSAIFAGAAVTDWLDGYLARKWNVTSPFGAFLDPVADKLMVSTALILITGRMGDWKMSICCSIILAREIGVSALREWMAQIGERGKVAVGYAGKVKTATQMVSLVLLLLMQPGASTGGVPEVGLTAGMILMYISTVLTVTSGWGYLQAAWPALMGKKS